MISPQEMSGYDSTGYQMIRSIEINNYRCFQRIAIKDVARLTVIVGDNGTGKTSLLEAIFLALGATTALPMRFRQQRGLESSFSGPLRRVEEALWGDLFHKFDLTQPLSVKLAGDGPEARSVTISRPSSGVPGAGSILVKYRDAKGKERSFAPDISQGPQGLPDTGEDLPNFFYFPSMLGTPVNEVVGRFSELSRANRHRSFVELFVKEYEWLKDINIEMVAGSVGLYGTIANLDKKVALNNISGGINRLASILITLASQPKAIMLADEIENGVFYAHQAAIWRGLLRVLRETDGQLITTTHSRECLQALVEAAGDNVSDIALWRVDRTEGQPILSQFSGDTLKAGLELGAEVRTDKGDEADDVSPTPSMRGL